MSELVHLTYIAVIMVIGLLSYLLSNKLKFPHIVFLIAVGMIITASSQLFGTEPLELNPTFLYSISILVLVLVVFDATSRISMKEVDTSSVKATLLVACLTVMNVTVLATIIYYLLGLPFFISVLYASLLTGSAVDVVLPFLKDASNKVFNILKLESIINTPLTVIVPFFIVDVFNFSQQASSNIFGVLVLDFLQTIVTGVGAGVVIGLIIFKIMRQWYSEQLSPIALVVAALLSYILAENLGGNGVLAVSALGLVFGYMYVKGKTHMQEFSSVAAIFLEILVFVLVGTLIVVHDDLMLVVASLMVFIIMILLRYIVIHLLFRKEFRVKELFFLTLNAPKGIATAVVVLSLQLVASDVPGMQVALNGTLLIILYSIILGTIVTRYQHKFLRRGSIHTQPTP